MPTILSQSSSKRLAYLEWALPVDDPSLVPRDADGFNRLMDQQGVEDEERRSTLLRLFLAGAFVLFLSYSSTYASIDETMDQDWLTSQLDYGVRQQAAYHRRLAEQYIRGELDVDEFQRLMEESITESHAAVMLAIFGISWVTLGYLKTLHDQYVGRELGYLNRLFDGLRAGIVPHDGNLIRRAAMYGFAIRTILAESQRVRASLLSYSHEQNILGVAEHCDGCLNETSRGIVPIGTLVPIGSRDCMSNCQCHLIFWKYDPETGEYLR